MSKIAVFGDRDSVCGFACLGIETVTVIDENQAKTAFKRMINDNYAVIYITEHYAEILKTEISKLADCVTPCIILIPGVTGNTGEGIKNINKSVEKAVGSLILD